MEQQHAHVELKWQTSSFGRAVPLNGTGSWFKPNACKKCESRVPHKTKMAYVLSGNTSGTTMTRKVVVVMVRTKDGREHPLTARQGRRRLELAQ